MSDRGPLCPDYGHSMRRGGCLGELLLEVLLLRRVWEDVQQVRMG